MHRGSTTSNIVSIVFLFYHYKSDPLDRRECLDADSFLSLEDFLEPDPE